MAPPPRRESEVVRGAMSLMRPLLNERTKIRLIIQCGVLTESIAASSHVIGVHSKPERPMVVRVAASRGAGVGGLPANKIQ